MAARTKAQLQEECERLRRRVADLEAALTTNISAVRRIRQGGLPAGAIDYVLKSINPERLAGAMMSACAGKPTLTQEIGPRLIEVSIAPPALGRDITPREIEVLQHLVDGSANAEIAQRLGISPSTVRNHMSSIMSKLGAASRTQAATLALQHKLVSYTL
jgi:DNA-binding NarL/FixJ family response regulator